MIPVFQPREVFGEAVILIPGLIFQAGFMVQTGQVGAQQTAIAVGVFADSSLHSPQGGVETRWGIVGLFQSQVVVGKAQHRVNFLVHWRKAVGQFKEGPRPLVALLAECLITHGKGQVPVGWGRVEPARFDHLGIQVKGHTQRQVFHHLGKGVARSSHIPGVGWIARRDRDFQLVVAFFDMPVELAIAGGQNLQDELGKDL